MDKATGQGWLSNDDAVKLPRLLQKAKITDGQSMFRANDVRGIMPAQPGAPLVRASETIPKATHTPAYSSDSARHVQSTKRRANPW
jgi:hypothetical protein